MLVQEWLAEALIAVAILTGTTDARTPVVWFKICPVLLTASAVLLILASFGQGPAPAHNSGVVAARRTCPTADDE